MTRRMTARRRAVRYGAVPLALILALSGCGGDDKPKAGKSPSQKASQPGSPAAGVIASVPLEHKDGPGHVDLLALSRTAANTVTARFKFFNDGTNSIDLNSSLAEPGHSDDPGLGDALAASGIGLLDAGHDKLYFPLQRTEGPDNCLCTKLFRTQLNPGGSVDVYATFPSPPPGVQKATIVIPLAVPFQDVPITGDAIQLLSGQIDPATAQLKSPPRIFDVKSLAEGVEQSVDDDPNNRAVRLSADVLFAINKADLTPRAEQLLQQLAKQIDASKGATVKVDGYADNTGNDAINQPLSERRAQAVADRLKSLVTRQGVTYQAAGHGSNDPVATNDTDEGRRKNRRVTVMFARPPAPAPPAASGQPYQRGSSAVLGSATFAAAEAQGLKVEVNSLHRDSTGLTILVWTLRNTGKGSPDVGTKLEKTAFLHGSAAPQARELSDGGVMLFDPNAKVRYNSQFIQTGPCLCSLAGRDEMKKVIGPGESVVYWNAYKPPSDVGALDVKVPWQKADDAVVKGLTIR